MVPGPAATSTARLLVDLDALAHNYSICSQALQQIPLPVVTGAVVKANAYGLGASAASEALCAQGCTQLFVANASEGQALRQHLPNAEAVRIYVFEGALPQTVATLAAAGLTPVLNSVAQLQLWQSVCAETRSAAELGLVLHVDTGMQRLGFAPTQLQAAPLVDLQPQMLVTHLACADEPGHPSIAEQLQCMAEVVTRFPGCTLSVANSAGTLASQDLAQGLEPLRGHVNQLLARPGVALYGGEAFSANAQTNAHAQQLWPVACLQGQVLQLRELEAGCAVGYGASFVAPSAMRIATVGLGYADGLPRLLSNSGSGFVAGHRVPIVGRVSMDLTCVDVTGVSVAEGDWVEYFGANLALAEVAQAAQTIDYEILCGVGARVPRIYQAL